MKEKKSSFMGNVLMLMFSQILIKVLGLVYRLVIMNVPGFGDLGNGYYSAGYQIYAVLLTISSQGIPSAVSRLVSEKVAIGEYKSAHRIFKIAMGLFAIVGGFFSLFLYVFSDFIASNILNVPDVKYVLRVLAPAIFFVTTSAVFRGYFAGLGTMKPTSVSQTLEQLFNCTLTITFVYALVGKEPYIMAAGGNLSTTLAILISFSYLLMYYRRNNKKYERKYKNIEQKADTRSVKSVAKTILMSSIPITIGSIISVVNMLIDTVTVSNCIQIAYEGIIQGKELLEQEAMRLTGILSKVDTIANLPIAINLAFSSALVPAISSAIAKKDYKSASSKITFSMSASLLIVIPCAVGFIVLANPILKMLYPSASDGAGILQIAAITMIFVAINHTLNGALYGLNKLYIPAIALTCGSVVKIILNLILIRNPNINIYGATISSLICQVITFIITYRAIKSAIKIKLNIKNNLIKPLFAGIIMGIVIFAINYFLKSVINNYILTICNIGIGAIIYLFVVAYLKVLNKEEICALPMGNKIYGVLRKLKIYA